MEEKNAKMNYSMTATKKSGKTLRTKQKHEHVKTNKIAHVFFLSLSLFLFHITDAFAVCAAHRKRLHLVLSWEL